MSDHVDQSKLTRKGYFFKSEKGMPFKTYGRSCKNGGRGYLGPRHEAHHVLPQTSIEGSTAASSKDQAYLDKVKYITDWNINHKGNMMGLPQYHAYHLYYQGLADMEAETDSEREGALVDWFNKFRATSRKKWLGLLQQTESPEGFPIHNPVNWGHVKYNDQVQQMLVEEVWDQLDDQRQDHELDATTVKAQLEDISQTAYDYLVQRGGKTSKERWRRRDDPDDNGWYPPFTMADVPNPVFS